MQILNYILNKGKGLQKSIAEYEYISFDIFDTLIKRRCGSPDSIFDRVEELYNSKYESKIFNFRKERISAEGKARIKKDDCEITIEDIYRELLTIYRKEEVERLMEEELYCEIEQCIANEEVVTLYNDLVEQGKNVYIVSDMYLDKITIQKILEKNNIAPSKKLYLSSVEKAVKRDGSLFERLLNDIKITPKKCIHIGDNFKSDFYMPKKLGMQSFLYEK